MFFLTEADESTVSALDRATQHLLAVRHALSELGPEGDAKLRPAADALLLDLARHIASAMVPVVPTCGFRLKPATDSEMKPAGVPI